ILLCGIGAWCGWKIGGVFSLIFLFTGFLGSWFASNYYSLFSGFFDPHPQAIVYGYLCVFGVIFLIMLIIGYLVHKLVRLMMLGFVNRLCGVLCGITLGIVLCSGILIPLSTLDNAPVKRLIRRSIIARKTIAWSEKIIAVFPPKKKKIFDFKMPRQIQKLEKKIKHIPHELKKLKP
ncbi:MAG: hypothetical protein GF384_05355, partial [Elusimicrobia bacterium]|nr:hypothetical protein [Elusimicrobiota bacterium]MBD3412210.1 hypothetical protein [Elusimicrobiota bacterium]